jgi:hypothetical protein
MQYVQYPRSIIPFMSADITPTYTAFTMNEYAFLMQVSLEV